MKTIKADDIPVEVSAGQFLRSLDLSREEVVFEEGGEVRVVLMSPRVLEQRRQAREQLFAVIDQIRRRTPCWIPIPF